MYQFLNFLEVNAIETKFIDLEVMIKSFGNDAISFIKGLIAAIIVILVGKKVIKVTLRLFEKYFERSKIEISVSGFLIAFIRAIMYIILIVTAVSFVGIKSGSIVALVGSAGLTLGLALQGSLSNLAGGVLLLILKPFKVGDYIISGGNEGTVNSIDLFYTRLLTIDNRLLVMPNGALSNTNIINASNETNRRLDLVIPVDYSENLPKVRELLMNIITDNEMVLKDQEMSVYVSNLDGGSMSIGIRVWVKNENYWNLKCILLEQTKHKFAESQITIPYNQMDVNIRNRT